MIPLQRDAVALRIGLFFFCAVSHLSTRTGVYVPAYSVLDIDLYMQFQLTLSYMLGPYGPTMNSPPDKEMGCDKEKLMNEPCETTVFPIQ